MKPAFLQQIISGVLVLWLSGVALLFCCGNMEARAAETDSCPLAGKSHCDRQSGASGENKPDFASFQRQSLTFDCCGFLPKVFDRARNIEKIPQAAAPAATAIKISAPKFSFVARAAQSPKIYRAVVHNRGSTYLKNRVFRI